MTEPDQPGVNARPLGETIAGTGPGIADDALGVGEELPEAPSDAEVGEVARILGADIPEAHGQAAPAAEGDVAPEGTPGTGENVCRACNGTGTVGSGTCPTCGGTGVVIEGIGGG